MTPNGGDLCDRNAQARLDRLGLEHVWAECPCCGEKKRYTVKKGLPPNFVGGSGEVYMRGDRGYVAPHIKLRASDGFKDGQFVTFWAFTPPPEHPDA